MGTYSVLSITILVLTIILTAQCSGIVHNTNAPRKMELGQQNTNLKSIIGQLNIAEKSRPILYYDESNSREVIYPDYYNYNWDDSNCYSQSQENTGNWLGSNEPIINSMPPNYDGNINGPSRLPYSTVDVNGEGNSEDNYNPGEDNGPGYFRPSYNLHGNLQSSGTPVSYNNGQINTQPISSPTFDPPSIFQPNYNTGQTNAPYGEYPPNSNSGQMNPPFNGYRPNYSTDQENPPFSGFLPNYSSDQANSPLSGYRPYYNRDQTNPSLSRYQPNYNSDQESLTSSGFLPIYNNGPAKAPSAIYGSNYNSNQESGFQPNYSSDQSSSLSSGYQPNYNSDSPSTEYQPNYNSGLGQAIAPTSGYQPNYNNDQMIVPPSGQQPNFIGDQDNILPFKKIDSLPKSWPSIEISTTPAGDASDSDVFKREAKHHEVIYGHLIEKRRTIQGGAGGNGGNGGNGGSVTIGRRRKRMAWSCDCNGDESSSSSSDDSGLNIEGGAGGAGGDGGSGGIVSVGTVRKKRRTISGGAGGNGGNGGSGGLVSMRSRSVRQDDDDEYDSYGDPTPDPGVQSEESTEYLRQKRSSISGGFGQPVGNDGVGGNVSMRALLANGTQSNTVRIITPPVSSSSSLGHGQASSQAGKRRRIPSEVVNEVKGNDSSKNEDSESDDNDSDERVKRNKSSTRISSVLFSLIDRFKRRTINGGAGGSGGAGGNGGNVAIGGGNKRDLTGRLKRSHNTQGNEGGGGGNKRDLSGRLKRSHNTQGNAGGDSGNKRDLTGRLKRSHNTQGNVGGSGGAGANGGNVGS